jgi:membrane fusion protein (multidrug efflux system)
VPRPVVTEITWVRAYLIAIALLAVLFGSIGGYQYLRFAALARAGIAVPPVTIAAATANIENRASYLEAVGTIRAVRGVSLSAETSGQITAIDFDSGDEVAAGQVLLVLNDEVEQAARQNEIATAELARILYERDLKLIAQKSISQDQLDRSKADLARARAQVAETEARIRNKRIHAPFAGTVGIRHVNLGDYVEPGTVIASLQDKSQLDVDFTLPARHAAALRPGLRIAVQVDAWPGRSFGAELRALDANIDTGTRNLLVRARILETEGLLPGMFATLRLDLGRDQPVVTVPETAITYSLQGDTVYVLEQQEGALRAVPKIVTVGETRSGRAAVLTGLAGGERVVTAGQNKLFRGATVLVDDAVNL